MDLSEKAYMQSPLVLWVESFKANDGHPLEYQDLYDGVFLNDVMQQIDPRRNYENVNRNVDDASVRLANWDVLVKNIRGYYMEVLQQLLVMRLPNISIICKDPGKDSSFIEIRKTLLLILGCAVQCENKEMYIDKIMAMDIRTQTEIVENIKEVTDDCESILPTQRPDSPGGSKMYMDKMFHHLHRLIKERDDCAELVSDLGHERDFYMSQADGKVIVDTVQTSPQKHHIALELAECKAKLRHLRQEVEDYHEQVTDVKEELKKSSITCSKLKNENVNLIQEARATRSLRDELDIMKEKATKVDMFEKEILKYKERLNELEFYKARTEELKEDNSILEETKAMLEDQLTNSRKRIETVVELEAELGRYRLKIENLTRVRDDDREKIEYLTGENARLEFEKKSSMNESASLENELLAARSRIGNIGGSLSDQLSEKSHAHILRLEHENQRLTSKLAEMKEKAIIESAEISLELEKENQRLVKRMEKLQTSACESSEQVVQIETELSTVKEEKERLTKALEAVKEHSDRQVGELERENDQLTQTLDSIRERSEKTSDAKVKDLERENRRLHEAVATKNSAQSKQDFETRQLQLTVQQLQDNVERIQSMEQDCQHLDKENSELHQKVATLQRTTERLEAIEHENSDLNVENSNLKKTTKSLQLSLQRREHLEQEHISLKVEHQRLQKIMESLKAETEKAIDLETERDDLKKEIHHLEKSLEGQKIQKLKQDQIEFEIVDLTNENQRLQKNLEVTSRRLQQLEKDNIEIELEGEKLTKELESLRLTSIRLKEKEKETTQLDSELQRLQIDKTSLEKENRKLKQSAELKDASLEDLSAKFASLDQESKSLRASLDKMSHTCSKVKDMEKENKQLLQDLNTDRRTLATLREELVSEKVKSQELNNQMEQLTGELERIGIDTEKLKMAEQINEENRYKALETMIEETMNKSRELKEEKIQTLEMRLDESKKRNSRLQEDLKTAKKESEVMKVRLEENQEESKANEEVLRHRQEVERDRPVLTANIGHTSKEIMELKERRIELERMNATLLAENKNLKVSNSQLSKQCKDIEAQLANWQLQNSSIQSNSSILHERIANLQVENTTLKSQCSSTLSQQDLLKEHISRLEVENESLLLNKDKLEKTHNALITDHESLQRLHEQLTLDYEKLLKEHNSSKSLQKTLKAEVINLQEQLNVLLQGKDDVNRLKDALESERDQLKRELQSLGNLKSDYAHLSDDHKQMTIAYDKLSKDYSDVLNSHKQVKTDLNNLHRKATEQHGEITEAKENLSVADVEFQKLENKMEAIYQVNERLENENQALLLQVQQLLNQNQDLLTQALNSKDHFAEEEKAYMEKLSDLRRQKERLEEKIMEHYKNRISPKKKSLGALIARKARGIISRAPRRSKSRNNLNEMNDNSSQGSGSNEHASDPSKKFDSEKNIQRSKSRGVEETDDAPKLASQNRSLAKSYTALHSPVFENELSHLRGAKSSEDLNEANASDGCLLPGLGRPYHLSEEDGSLHDKSTVPSSSGRRNMGRSSPGSEMLTLDQFLKEANKSRNEDEHVPHETSEKILYDHQHADNDSHGSDISNGSASRLHHHMSSHGMHQSSSFQNHTHDTAVSSFTSPIPSRDMSMSMSKLSQGSGNNNASFDSSGAVAGDIFTSTPKTDPDSSVGYRRFGPHFSGESKSRDGDSTNSSREPSLEKDSNPYRVNILGNPHPSSSPRNPASFTSTPSPFVTVQNPIIASTSPLYSQSALNSNNSNSNDRDLSKPSIPSELPPSLLATERLDRLTHQSSSGDQGMAWRPGGRPGQWPLPNQKDSGSANREIEAITNKNSEIIRRRSHGATEGGSKGLPNQFHPPIPRSHPGAPTAKRNVLSTSQSFDVSVVSGHNARRPSGNSNLFENNPQQRARPASVMGQTVQVRGVYSRPPGEGRPQSQHHATLPKNASEPSNTRPSMVERPKSVPPQLFKPLEKDATNVLRRDIPVPPPRRTRVDLMDNGKDHYDKPPQGQTPPSSNVSLIREPSRRGSLSQYDLQSRPSSQSHELNKSIPQTHNDHPNYLQKNALPPRKNCDNSNMPPSNNTYQEHSPSIRNSSVPSNVGPSMAGHNRPMSLSVGGTQSHQGSRQPPSRPHSSMSNHPSFIGTQKPHQTHDRSSTPGPQLQYKGDPASGLKQGSFEGVPTSSGYRGQGVGSSNDRYNYRSDAVTDYDAGKDSQNTWHHQQRPSQNLFSSNSRSLSEDSSLVHPHNRQPPGFYGDQSSTNGPLSPQTGRFNDSLPLQHLHDNLAPQSLPVQPKIRSHSKAPPMLSSQSNPSREPVPGLSSTLPNTASLNQENPPPTNAPRQEGEGEGQQPKHANSIWYEYGCV